MARAAVYTVLAMCVVWLSGCGTVINLIQPRPYPEGPEVYGGVADAARSVREWAKDTSERYGKGDSVDSVVTPSCEFVLSQTQIGRCATTSSQMPSQAST